jgi:hypothetical protein
MTTVAEKTIASTAAAAAAAIRCLLRAESFAFVA